MNIPTMQRRIVELNDRNQALVAQAKTQNRDLFPDEQAEFDRNAGEFDWLIAELDKHDAVPLRGRHTEPQLPEPQNRRPDEVPAQSPYRRSGTSGRTPGATEEAMFNKLLPGTTQLAAMNRGRSDGAQFAPGEFVRNLVMGTVDHRFRPMNADMLESTGMSGGFLLPSVLSAAVFDQSLGLEIIRPRARTLLLGEGMGNEYTAPLISFHDRETMAGLRAAWVGEGTQVTPKALNLGRITGHLKKAMLLVKSSNELLSDAARFEQTLAEAMALSLAWTVDEALIAGTGVGKPLGILNTSSSISVPKVAGQTADTLVFQNIVDMWSRLVPGSANNAVWLAHPSCIAQLMVLQAPVKNVAGTENVGGTASVFLQSAAENVPSTLLGRPILFSEHLPILGDSGDLVLVDLSQVIVVIRPNLGVAIDPFSRFDSDSTLFRLIARLDSVFTWPDAVKPKGGAPTLGWCIKLEDRA